MHLPTLNHMLALVKRRLRREVVGLYVDQETIFVTDLVHDQSQQYERHAIVPPSDNSIRQICSILVWLRHQYKSWRRLTIVLCTPDLTLEQRMQLRDRARTMRSEVFFIQFEMCAAIGAGIDVDAPQKQLVAFVTDSTVQLYLLFGGGFDHETDTASYRADDFTYTLEDQVSTLKDAVRPRLPQRFDAFPFPDHEREEFKPGWSRSYAETLYMIFLCDPLPVHPATIGGHWIVTVEQGTQKAMLGLERFMQEAIWSETGHLFLRLLRSGYRGSNDLSS